MTLNYVDSGYFTVEVEPAQRDKSTYTFNGRVIDDWENKLDLFFLRSGRFTFPIVAENTQVKIRLLNESYLPSNFISAEWNARQSDRINRR